MMSADRSYLCPLDNRTECPMWGGPCSVNMALDCTQVHDAAYEDYITSMHL
jgi:hypothetical protein